MAESNGSEAWEPILLAADYHFAIFEGVNKFFVRGEDKHLLARLNAPANPSDRFLIYGYLKRINDLERQLSHYKEIEQSVLSNCKELEHSLSQTERSLSQYDDLSPMALGLARRAGEDRAEASEGRGDRQEDRPTPGRLTEPAGITENRDPGRPVVLSRA